MMNKLKDLYDSFSGYAFKSKDFLDTGIPLIRISDMIDNKVKFSKKTAYLSSKYLREYSKYEVKKGDIVIALSGASLGKFAIYENDEPALLNQRILLIREKKEDVNALTNYLLYYLQIHNRAIRFKAVGGAQPNISPNKVLSFDIEHSIVEQSKIIVQLAKIQILIDKREETLKLLENYKGSIFSEMFGDPYLNEHQFSLKKLSDLVKKDTIITYGIVQAGPNIANGIPYIKSGDIKNGRIDIENLNRTSKDIAQKYERSKCETGDIIITIRATIGDVAILPKELNGANLTRGTARISVDKKNANNNFIYSLLASKGGKALINKKAKGTTFKDISTLRLRDIKIPIPDLRSQKNFEKKFLIVESQKLKYQKSLQFLNTLYKASLNNFFINDVQVNEEKIFEDLLKDLSIEDLKTGNRLKYIINWLKKDNKVDTFSDIEKYNLAISRVLELLEEGSLEQYSDDNNIKLRVAL